VAALVDPRVPLDRVPRARFLADAGRSMGTLCCATRGTGKSRLLGRALVFQDIVRGVPTVVLDPVGGLIDNAIDKLTRLPEAAQRALWPRVRYVNMAGEAGRVVPWPIYSRAAADESLFSIAQRFVDVIRRADPALATASIQGFNRLAPLASAAGIVLSGLGLGITEAEDLLANVDGWQGRLAEVVARFPEAAPAVSHLQYFGRLSASERAQRAEPLANKLSLFRFDPLMRATFGASGGGIDWAEVAQKRLAVLVDFRGEYDLARLQFKLLWVFYSLLDYIKRRGPGRHKVPFSLVIDELSYLVGSGSLNADILTADFEELINRIARNHGVWLTLALQEQYQIPERLLATLLSMGNQIYGSTSDLEAAKRLALRFGGIDPFRVKRFEPVYSTVDGRTTVIDRRPVDFNLEEQTLLGAQPFMQLPRFHFLVGASPQEGKLPTQLTHVSTERLDQGVYVNEPLVAEARRRLMERDGVVIQHILKEIEQRRFGASNTYLNGSENSTTIRKKGISDNTRQSESQDDIPAYDEDHTEAGAGERNAFAHHQAR
jgi:hypothetical protein